MRPLLLVALAELLRFSYPQISVKLENNDLEMKDSHDYINDKVEKGTDSLYIFLNVINIKKN